VIATKIGVVGSRVYPNEQPVRELIIMSNPAEGKYDLTAEVYLSSIGKRVKLDNVFVYIHLKGYALARVTHLDIEHDVLDSIILPKRGSFLNIKGVKNGIEIELEIKKEIEYKERITPQNIYNHFSYFK
jgi:hypothetical protein